MAVCVKRKRIQKAAENYNVKAVCGVGMRRACEEALKDMVERNQISDTIAFYLQGGYDVNKLNGIYKFLMKMMSKVILKEIEKRVQN